MIADRDDRPDTAYAPPLAQGRQWTIATARRELAQQFRQASLDTPDLDARVLVGHALALDHTAMATQAERRLTESEADDIATLTQRRLTGEPVARIVGAKEFWGLPLWLNADTLIPRPETETVVEAALAALRPRLRTDERAADALRIADLDTGSGALLLALLSELPEAHGIGTDISTAALACAQANAVRLGFGKRASFVACDHGAALRDGFDLVVANPPYVASADIAGLAREVRAFDPRRALDGGPDGLSAYRAIARDARRLLAPDGVLVVELGAGQLDAVTALMMGTGLEPAASPRCDLAGIPRALTIRPVG